MILEDQPKLVGIFHVKEITKRDHVVLFSSKIPKKASLEVSTFEIESSEFFPLDALPIDLDLSSKLWIEQSLAGDKVNVHAPSL